MIAKQNALESIKANIHILESLKKLVEKEDKQAIKDMLNTKQIIMIGSYTLVAVTVLLTDD